MRTHLLPQQANFHHLVLDIAWFGLAHVTINRFLAVYAIRVDASPAQLGWMTALPGLMLLCASVMGRGWRRRYPDSVSAVAGPAFWYRFMFLLPAFTPFLPKVWQPFWLILSVSLPAIPQGVATVIFLTMIRETIDAESMPRLVSRRALALNITVGIGALGFGFWLERAPFPLNYQVMFIAGYIMAMLSLRHVMNIRPLENVDERPVRVQSLSGDSPWHSPMFLKMALIVVAAHITFFSVFPISPMRLMHDLDASESFMAIFALMELAAGATAAYFIPRVIARFGSRNTISVALVGTASGALIIALAPTLPITLLAAVITGGSWASADIAIFMHFTEKTAKLDLMRYTTAYIQVIFAALFVGPMIGSYLATSGINLSSVLIIGAGLRLCAAVVPQIEFPTRNRLILRHTRSK